MERVSLQQFSYWPAWPLPEPVSPLEMTVTPRHACSYLPDRWSVFRAFEKQRVSPEYYQRLMDAGFRRSGSMIYQPICPGCRRCVPIRVPVDRFRLTKSQRRVLRNNSDLVVRVGRPESSAEKWTLYEQYQREWHDGKQAGDPLGFISFLYRSPVESVEFEYRDALGRLLGVGICDVSIKSVSSVYFYFDPAEERRSLGTFSALYEIQWARAMKVPYWYAGYWVDGCREMEYKTRFKPCEVLGTDGVWRERVREEE